LVNLFASVFIRGETQEGWRWCLNCEALFHQQDGPGVCPRNNSAHSAARSGAYTLAMNEEGPGQPDWKWCHRCKALFFDGNVDKGRCPAASGQGHDGSRSANYRVRHGDESTGQAGWRWCHRCAVLFFSGNSSGHCPVTGNAHEAGSMTRYVVDVSSVQPTVGTATPAAGGTGQIAQPLTGAREYADDCSADERDFHEVIMRYGRIASVSGAYLRELQRRLLQNYQPCAGDPFSDLTPGQRVKKVLEITSTANAVRVNCRGGRGNANANIGRYDHADIEAFAWSDWFASVHQSLTLPLCGAPRVGTNCRWEAFPWPFTQASGIVWHEVMHTHGYVHGADNPETETDLARTRCGQANNSNWHFQRNTAPYIVGDTMLEAIAESSTRCSGLKGCPVSNQRSMVRNFGAAGCECVTDPSVEPALLRITAPAPGMVVDSGRAVSFSAVTGGTNRVEWEFPGGMIRTGHNVSFAFSTPGPSVVIARIPRSVREVPLAEASLIVDVLDRPVVSIVDPVQGAVLPLGSPVRLQGYATDASEGRGGSSLSIPNTQLAWTISTGEVAAPGRSAVVTFTTPGPRTITLSATNRRSTASASVSVEVRGESALRFPGALTIRRPVVGQSFPQDLSVLEILLEAASTIPSSQTVTYVWYAEWNDGLQPRRSEIGRGLSLSWRPAASGISRARTYLRVVLTLMALADLPPSGAPRLDAYLDAATLPIIVENPPQ